MTGARHDYHLSTAADGTVEGRAWTNDDLDRGVPTEEAQWDVSYKSVEEALKRTGGTHTGVSGCMVNVYLDGKLVGRQGECLEQVRERRAPRP